jgi:hypothetical protein
MSHRRKLDFARLDDIVPDVERLLAGHRTVGNWSLAQMCRHLSDEFRYSIDGFPTRLLPWVDQADHRRLHPAAAPSDATNERRPQSAGSVPPAATA